MVLDVGEVHHCDHQKAEGDEGGNHPLPGCVVEEKEDGEQRPADEREDSVALDAVLVRVPKVSVSTVAQGSRLPNAYEAGATESEPELPRLPMGLSD